MDNNKYYSIGEMAQICDINAKTLRYYDQIGLVVPEYKNMETGYRYYGKDQIFTICIVKKLQLMDFSLKEMKKLILSNDISLYENEIRKKIEKLNIKIEQMQKICEAGDFLIEKIVLRKELMKSYQHKDVTKLTINHPHEIQIETILKRDVISTKKEIKLYNNFEISIERWLEVYQLAKKNNMTITGSVILTYHNENVMDQFFKSSCNLEISLPVQIGEEEEKLPFIKSFGGFQAVTISHIGDYYKIMDTHIKALRWIEANEYRINGKISEEYIISPFDLKSEDIYLTKIMIPVVSLKSEK